jgi:hypothetical protein
MESLKVYLPRVVGLQKGKKCCRGGDEMVEGSFVIVKAKRRLFAFCAHTRKAKIT